MREGSDSTKVEHGDPGDRSVRGGSVEGAYRGFLFADLRGFTAFVESRGERSATDLLDAYRSLVREQVSQHAGAEIRTEGDSFYVVFPSARAAVACGLTITAAAARYLELHPDRPIRVGIGINAGEATQHGEGFVGTAVNLAARVCTQARAGEVLVTGTVREAVRGASDLRFVPRGSQRLKGIAESVPLFAVQAAGAPSRRAKLGWSARGRPSEGVGIASLVIAAALVLVLGLAVRGAWLGGEGDGSSTGSSSAPAASPASTILASASATGAAATVAAVADAFPNPDETALLVSVGVDVEHCQRADLADRPRLSIDAGTAEVFGVSTTRPPLAVWAGVTCTIPSEAAPSSLHYWSTGQMFDYNAASVPVALIQSDAGTFDVPGGDCAVGTPAVGRWSFGGSEGLLLCRELYGDAVLEWTYDGRPILGVASRRDGDHVKLYAWWRGNARFLHD
jgi:class 3 adenylate cyclase